MIRPIRSATAISQSPDAEKNAPVNDFIRGQQSILPRNFQQNPILRSMFGMDAEDDGESDDE